MRHRRCTTAQQRHDHDLQTEHDHDHIFHHDETITDAGERASRSYGNQ
jgi:hypothetical protein